MGWDGASVGGRVEDDGPENGSEDDGPGAGADPEEFRTLF